MAYLRCPDCGQVHDYCSLDLTSHGWNDVEEFDFVCKSCGAELKLEIDYGFRFFESINWHDDGDFDPYIDDVVRWTPAEAKAQYEREHAPKPKLFAKPKEGLFAVPEKKGLFTAPEKKGLFAVPEKKGLFSLPAKGLFSLNRRKR